MPKKDRHTKIFRETDTRLCQLIHTLEGIFKKYLGQADPAHDIKHSRRILAIAKGISEFSSCNQRVIAAAAYLHDCEKISGKNAGIFINQHLKSDFRESESLIIIEICRQHSYSSSLECTSLESKVLSDADKIDALGAMGICRLLFCAASVGSEIYSEIDPFCEQRPPNGKEFAIDHFIEKILKLEDLMYTDGGREIARNRSAIVKRFLRELRSELGEVGGYEPRLGYLTQAI